MENLKYNTDMADERVDEYKVIHNMSEIDGIKVKSEKYEEFSVTEVDVLNENGKRAIDKDIGKYITFEMENVKYIDDEDKVIKEVSKYLHKLITDENASVMVVGLGNMYITPDALGAKVIKKIDVTRHILKLASNILPSKTREVSAICPGVMGNTGIETEQIVKSIALNVKPNYLIVIDSLMSKSMKRVGASIQICDTGITPGSGISNINNKIDEKIGAKVISIGVPMVVDIATITENVISKVNGKSENDEKLYNKISKTLDGQNYIVTPKDIDDLIEIMSNIISKAINITM